MKKPPKSSREFWPKLKPAAVVSWYNWVTEKLNIDSKLISDIGEVLDKDFAHSYHRGRRSSKFMYLKGFRKRQAKKPEQDPKMPKAFCVNAFATAETYRMDELLDDLTHMWLTRQAYYIGGNVDIIHCLNYKEDSTEPSNLFIFREGVTVLWNWCAVGTSTILKTLADNQNFGYPDEKINATSECLFYLTQKHVDDVFSKQDLVALPSGDNFHEKYACSCALATSVRLSVRHRVLDTQIASMLEDVAIHFKYGDTLRVSENQLLKLHGALYSLQQFMVLNDVVYYPMTEERPEEIDNYYHRICLYLSVPRRTDFVKDRLNHCFGIMHLIAVLFEHKRHGWLAILYIGLFVVSVWLSISSTWAKIKGNRIRKAIKEKAAYLLGHTKSS